MSVKIASVVCFSISSTPDLAYSNEERGGDEGEVLGEDAAAGLLAAVLGPVLGHVARAGVVRLPRPELRHLPLVLLLPPRTVRAVHPPRDEVGRVRHAAHPHAGVGGQQPVRHVVTVEPHAEPARAAARQHEVRGREQTVVVAQAVHDISAEKEE